MSGLKRALCSFIIIYLLITYSSAFSTHLRAGYIHVEQADPNSLEMKISLIIYTNMESMVPPGGGKLDFGDGSEPLTIPDLSAFYNTGDNPGIGVAQYQTIYKYNSTGYFKISYSEPNRDSDIKNILNSVNTKFHMETSFIINPSLGRVNTSHPLLNMFHIFHFDQNNFLGFTMEKTETEVYTYHLATPLQERSKPVHYKWLQNPTIDPITGVFNWDLTKEEPDFYFSPDELQYSGAQFGFAIRSTQYKKANNEFIKSSNTLTDFQISVQPSVDDIWVSGGVKEHVIENNQTVKFQRIFVSAELPEITISSDLPPDIYSVSIDNIRSSESDSAIVNIEIVNNNFEDEGPYFILLRSKTPQKIKDDVLTIFFNEKYNYPENIITSIDLIPNPEVIVYPNPTRENIEFIFKGYDKLQLSMYSLNGRCILTKDLRSGEKINFKEDGIYFYNLMSRNILIKRGKIIVGK